MAGDLLSLLIVDDNEDDAILIARCFRRAGYGVATKRVDCAREMCAALGERDWDVVISDVAMPQFSAADALAIYLEFQCDCPFIVVSGAIGEETAVSLLKAGAHDFLLKTNLARLVPATERELRETESRRARRRAEDALRASEERYALAARGANDGLWDWDLKTNRIYFSPRWVEMLGFPKEQPGDRPDVWFRRVHRDDVVALRRSLDDHLGGRTPHFAVEYRIRHQDGSWRWMLTRGLAVIDPTGTPCRIAGSQTDITAAKEAEQQLRRSKEELEHAVAAKTRFLASASHDLRQPVQALVCFTSLLEMQLQAHPAAATVTDLGNSLDSLKSLLDALLDVSRLDAGVVTPDFATFPIATILDQVGAEMRPLAEAKGLRLRVAACDTVVRSDPVLLGRILRNLVENAIRYTEHGGILIGCRRAGTDLNIVVHDSGIGIDDDARGHIFEEFFQVANPERDRMKGLGLGLAIVARLSRLLEHPVTVRSTPGHGSSFAVSVPTAATQSPSQPRSVAEIPFDDPPGTILVLDDEAHVAGALAGLLKAWGFETVTASSLEEAITVVRHPPRAVLADYRLREGRTGLEAVRALRHLFAAPIPFIVVTGDTGTDRLREIVESRSVVLHKPVMPKDLRRALQTLLSASAAVAPEAASGYPHALLQ